VKNGRFWFQGALVGVLGVAVVGSTLAVSRPDYSFFDPLVSIKMLISQKYVSQPDEKLEMAMQAGAIEGMVEALNDPYTIYVPPADTKEFAKELTGDFVGIGVSVQMRNGWLTVVSPIENSPAFKAGILAEDKIVEIEGKTTLGLTSDQCIAMLTGEPGSSVNFVVEREGKRIPFALTRERVIAPSVKGFHWDGQATDKGGWQYVVDPARKIAYVRLTQFTPTASAELEEALKSIGADTGNVKGLILDLRWNPGGVLQDAIDIADLFLEDGVIVSTRGRAHPEEIARAKKDGTLPNFPMAVLLNSSSASASEVLSGALVENNRAVVVGTRSFGKGLVQTVHSIQPGGGELKITEQRYYLPSGRCIQRSEDSPDWGVDPTQGFYVPMTDEETIAMLKVRREEEIVGGKSAGESRWSEPAWIVDHLKDPQLAAALKAVQTRIDQGADTHDWVPTGQKLPESRSLAGSDLDKANKLRDRLEKELEKIDKKIESLQAAAPPDHDQKKDLWADSVDVSGGRVEVYDKDGKLIARLKVNGPDLERWLIDADVTKDEAGEKK
jgi:carboxyl-terminal processing protease